MKKTIIIYIVFVCCEMCFGQKNNQIISSDVLKEINYFKQFTQKYISSINNNQIIFIKIDSVYSKPGEYKYLFLISAAYDVVISDSITIFDYINPKYFFKYKKQMCVIKTDLEIGIHKKIQLLPFSNEVILSIVEFSNINKNKHPLQPISSFQYCYSFCTINGIVSGFSKSIGSCDPFYGNDNNNSFFYNNDDIKRINKPESFTFINRSRKSINIGISFNSILRYSENIYNLNNIHEFNVSSSESKMISIFPLTWDQIFKLSDNNKLNLFIFEEETINKYKIEYIIEHKLFKQIEIFEEDLIKTDWTIEYQ